MEHLRDTVSLCPTCRRKIPANVVERDGSVYMEKECPEHGVFQPMIAKYASTYKDLIGFNARVREHFPQNPNRIEVCAYTATLKCNLQCPVCFAGDQDRATPPEDDLATIRTKLEAIRGRGVHVKLTGGEPTMREDLPEIIRAVKDSGNYPIITTNGIKLQDYDYLRSLTDAGLYAVAPWFDSRRKNGIFEQMRGERLLEQREKVLANITRLGLKFIAFFTCVKDVNESELRDVMRLSQSYPDLFRVAVEGYMHRGSKGFSDANAYTPDELWEVIVDATDVFSSLDELFTMIKVHLLSRMLRGVYYCCNTQFLLMPRSDRRDDALDPAYWDGVLRRFEELLTVSPAKAEKYFMRRYIAALLKKGFFMPLVRRFIFRQKGLPEVFLPSNYYWLAFQVLYYPENYDEEMVRDYCFNTSLNPGMNRRMSFCEYYNVELKT